jgi:hypothetical protein
MILEVWLNKQELIEKESVMWEGGGRGRRQMLKKIETTGWVVVNNSMDNAPVTLCRFGSPIRPDLKIGVDRGSVGVSRSKVWTGRG